MEKRKVAKAMGVFVFVVTVVIPAVLVLIYT